MTGTLTLNADPTTSLHAATKQYVDTRVLKSGDTMTGTLTLNADPTTSLHAATKQYVDTRVLKSGDTMTGALTLNADPTTSLHAATKQYVDNREFGVGQSWRNYSIGYGQERRNDVTYTNDTTRTIVVNVTINWDNSFTVKKGTAYGTVNNITIVSFLGDRSYAPICTISLIVPPGNTYLINGSFSFIANWAELR
jgi:hypothetical protein